MKYRIALGRTLLALALVAIAPPALTACELGLTPTKTANGQLYESGDAKYDPFFANVHQEQLAAANWAEEAKSSRKPLVTALSLRAGASNSLIVSAAREAKEKKSDVGGAVGETTSAERERAKRLKSAVTNLEALLKRGEELKKQTAEDRQNMGADKADEKKVEKKNEVKREMSAAVDAVETMLSDARRGAREAEELVDKLHETWGGAAEGAAAKDDKKEEAKDDKKKAEAPKKPAAKRPAAKGAAPAEAAAVPKPEPKAAPEPKPTPAQKPSDEVFNP
jgi:hypothetical protein